MSVGKDGATAGELLLALVDRVSHRGGDTLSLMNEAGTTLPQILFLARLRQAGGGTASDLADRLNMSLPAVSQMVDRLFRLDLLSRVLCLLIKYNALMALSAAKLPFAVPANIPLALIMICGYAASFALMVSMLATRPAKSTPKVGHAGLARALVIGFAPAALLGVPGLVGLAAAIVATMILIALLRYRSIAASEDTLDLTQLIAEASFYLGALASWRYV